MLWLLCPSGAHGVTRDLLPRVALRPLLGGLRSTRGYNPTPLRGEKSMSLLVARRGEKCMAL